MTGNTGENGWTDGLYRLTEDGQGVYVLNENGVNRIYARVQSGFLANGTRTSDDELRAVAQLWRAAPELYEALAEMHRYVSERVLVLKEDRPALDARLEIAEAALARACNEGGQGDV